jgi:hypothetical protein
MPVVIDLKHDSIRRLAENLAKAGQEGVKWERRRLDWIRQEKQVKPRAEEIESSNSDNRSGIKR